MAVSNLAQYYSSQGKSLPSVSQRAPLFEQYGLGKASQYTGSSEQNSRLLQALLGSGGGGATGGNPTNDFAQNILDAAGAQIKADLGAPKPFTASNPFQFDEALATASAKAEYDPYYTRLLDDYVGKIGVNRSTVGDQDALLKELQSTSLGTAGEANRAYTRATTSAASGYANSGLYGSGIMKRELGQSEAERNYDTLQTAQDINQTQRDIGEKNKAAVAGGVLQRRGEALTQYAAPLTQSYLSQFPISGGSPLSGYTVPEYLRY